jgi:hypothetical protein
MTDVTTAATAVLLRPDWATPATWLPSLAAHLANPQAGPLHLDATGGDPPAQVILGMLSEICAALSPGRPLPEIVVHDDPAELAAHLDLPAPDVPDELPAASAAAAMTRAATVKVLADRARWHIDRWRYDNQGPVRLRDPLVTVRIPTWRGHETLAQRTLPSVLGGGYERLEVLVCSDGPDPAAQAIVEDFARRDPRVRYLEVAERPSYPQTKINLHRVGGASAANALIAAARGDVQCPLDHDDAFTYDHVATLLATIERSGCDFVYGQSVCQMERGIWAINGVLPLAHGNVSHGAVAYTARLAHMRYDPDAWILREPGDWNLWRRMTEVGAKAGYVPSAVLVHFAERTAIDSVDEVPPQATPEEALADLRVSGADWMLCTPLPAELELS